MLTLVPIGDVMPGRGVDVARRHMCPQKMRDDMLPQLLHAIVKRQDADQRPVFVHYRHAAHALVAHVADGFEHACFFRHDRQIRHHDFFHIERGGIQSGRDHFHHNVAVSHDTYGLAPAGLIGDHDHVANMMFAHQPGRFIDRRLSPHENHFTVADFSNSHLAASSITMQTI